MGSPSVVPGPTTLLLTLPSHPEMARLFHWPSSSSLASLLLITILLLSFVSTSLCRSQYSSCFRSCHNCKAVCTDLHSIKNFLDLANLVDYDWAESNGI